MPIEIEELAPGLFKFNSMWDEGRSIYITLTLIGPDGIETTRKLTWTPVGKNMSRRAAVQNLAAMISGVQSWRAVQYGNELSIGVADTDYSGTVTLEVL